MPERVDDHSSKYLRVFQAIAGLVFSAGVIYALYAVATNLGSWTAQIRESNLTPLAIATSPEGATIIFDGKLVGISPVRVRTEGGAHSITARLEGHRPVSKAISLEYDIYEGRMETKKLIRKAHPWITNIALEPIGTPTSSANKNSPLPTAIIPTEVRTSPDIGRLQADVRNIRSMILANPEQAVSLSVVQGRVENLEKEVASLRQDVRASNDVRIGIMAILAGIFLAFVASVFGRRKGD